MHRSQVTIAVALVAFSRVAVAQTPAGVVERDSAGIHIVENRSRNLLPVRFALDARPAMDVGGRGDARDEEFHDHAGYLRAVRLSTGVLVVIDRDRVHYYDTQSRRIRTVDHMVGSPGQFGDLVAVCRTRGDTVLVMDNITNDVGVLDSAGKVVRYVRLADRESPQTANFCFDDGTFLVRRSLYDVATMTMSTRLRRLKTDGSPAGDLGTFVGHGFDVVTHAELRTEAFGRSLYLNDGMSNEIRIVDTTGAIRTIVRTNDPAVAITAADVERRLNEAILSTGLERETELIADRQRPHPATWPAYQSIHPDRAGRFWAKDYQPTEDLPLSWTAFDSTGHAIGRLVIPPPPKGEAWPYVLRFDGDAAIVRTMNPDGTQQHLQVRRVVPVPPTVP